MSDFWRQILLSVIDKGLLGVAAVWVGYRINVRLERFRARRALEGEFLRERTRRLDELYVAMLDVAAVAEEYVDAHMERIGTNEGEPDAVGQEAIKAANSVSAKFVKAMQTLDRKAAHYQPWIGDRLHAGCAEYRKVVGTSVIEQIIPVSADVDRMDQLKDRTRQLQAEIMAAIREGAPNAVIGQISGEQSPARPPALAPVVDRKQLGVPERS